MYSTVEMVRLDRSMNRCRCSSAVLPWATASWILLSHSYQALITVAIQSWYSTILGTEIGDGFGFLLEMGVQFSINSSVSTSEFLVFSLFNRVEDSAWAVEFS